VIPDSQHEIDRSRVEQRRAPRGADEPEGVTRTSRSDGDATDSTE
jgi:hypothetical protein